MIGLDTNVLVRYLTQDDPSQSARANRFFRSAKGRRERLFLNAVVLCGLVWVLESAYGHSRAEISGVLEKLLLTVEFEFEDRDSVRAAVQLYNANQADFSDYLIGRRNSASGCEKTVTFDHALKKNAAFELL